MSNTDEQFRISAKDLGHLAMPNFCRRCFWILRHMEGRPPFQIFPQIFTHIDLYTKRYVEGYFQRNGKVPGWLAGIGEVKEPLVSSTYGRLRYETALGVTLTGSPDAIFRLDDGSLAICDYKTARFVGDADPLLPIYRVQLNTYAFLAEQAGLGRTSRLVLVYTDPATKPDDAADPMNERDDGLAMSFRSHLMDLPFSGKELVKLTEEAMDCYHLPEMPTGLSGCADCRKLDSLVNAATASTPISMTASYASIDAGPQYCSSVALHGV